MISKRLILWLVGGAVLLPVALVLIWGLAALLGAMHDESGQAGLHRVALALGLVWALDLVCLVLALAFHALSRDDGLLDREP